ncbi:MAG: DUF5320 domain-containing protein [Candidatus Cloacimonetes bacterium]|nr:DUF5320 domain-containing protein [Candidatus Cloacimonadota bacterium]
MPRGDRTGPNGMGPMTGRVLGYCNNFASPGFGKMNPRGMGRGYFGRGGGFGRGFRRFPNSGWNYANVPDSKTQKAILEDEIKLLSDQLEDMKKQLTELSQDE